MADPDNGARRYEVHCSGAIAAALRRLQRRASRTGRGQAVAVAFRRIVQRLQLVPGNLGEPAYCLPGLRMQTWTDTNRVQFASVDVFRLPDFRMQIRTVIVRPLAVDFAVYEDQPLVFIKGVKLLSGPDK